MKLEVFENKFGLDIQLIPETVEEVSQLVRFALNANAEKPSVYMSFSANPNLSIWLRKRKEKAQKTSIKP